MSIKLNSMVVLMLGVALSGCIDQTIPETSNVSWHGGIGKFSAAMLIIDNHDQIVEGWEQSQGSLNVSTLPTISRVKKGEKAYVVVFFANCVEVENERCELRADFAVAKPDGTEYGAYADRTLWSGPAPPDNAVRLGLPYMEFVADPQDAVGAYRFSAHIRAPGADQAVDLARTLFVDAAD